MSPNLALKSSTLRTVTFEGDILAPLEVEWEAEAGTEPVLYPRRRRRD